MKLKFIFLKNVLFEMVLFPFLGNTNFDHDNQRQPPTLPLPKPTLNKSTAFLGNFRDQPEN
jgi:hypothetical protein